METWEKIVLGLVAVAVVAWLWPGMRRGLQEAPKGSADDWKTVVLLLVGVILFVLFLLSTA